MRYKGEWGAIERRLGIGLSVLMAMGILAGCGNLAAVDGDSGTVSKAKTKTEDVVEVTMITLNRGTNDMFAEAIQREVDKSNESNEYNVRIKLEYYSNDNYKTKLTVLMASNAQPGIFSIWESRSLQPSVDGDKVYPVGDILANDEEWYGAYPDKSVFSPLTFEDEIWAVSNSRQIVVVAYNNKLFQDAGTKVPATYSEFLETCETLKRTGISLLVIPCGEARYGRQMLQQLYNVLGGEGLYNYTISDGVQWSHKMSVGVGTLLKQTMDQGYLVDGFLGMSPSEGFELFNNGDMVMFMCIASGVNKLDVLGNPYYNDIDSLLLPSDNPDYNGVNVGPIGQTYVISSQVENPEAAAAFLKQVTPGGYQQVLTGNTQITATNVQVNLDNLSETTIRSRKMFDQMKVYTPRLDRIHGAGGGVEFNNASVFILGGIDPQEVTDDL